MQLYAYIPTDKATRERSGDYSAFMRLKEQRGEQLCKCLHSHSTVIEAFRELELTLEEFAEYCEVIRKHELDHSRHDEGLGNAITDRNSQANDLWSQVDPYIGGLQGIANVGLILEFLVLNNVNNYALKREKLTAAVGRILGVVAEWYVRAGKLKAIGNDKAADKIHVLCTDLMRLLCTMFRLADHQETLLSNFRNLSTFMRIIDIQTFEPITTECVRITRILFWCPKNVLKICDFFNHLPGHFFMMLTKYG